jgi:hypothetical protein
MLGKNKSDGQNAKNIFILQLIPINKIKLEKENIEKGVILNKKLENYYDVFQE